MRRADCRELRAAWERAIAATDRFTKALEIAMELNEARGLPFKEFREVGLQYEAAREVERMAGRAYLAALGPGEETL